MTNYVDTKDLTALAISFKELGQRAWDRALYGQAGDMLDRATLEGEANTWERAAHALNEVVVQRKVKL